MRTIPIEAYLCCLHTSGGTFSLDDDFVAIGVVGEQCGWGESDCHLFGDACRKGEGPCVLGELEVFGPREGKTDPHNFFSRVLQGE